MGSVFLSWKHLALSVIVTAFKPHPNSLLLGRLRHLPHAAQRVSALVSVATLSRVFLVCLSSTLWNPFWLSNCDVAEDDFELSSPCFHLPSARTRGVYRNRLASHWLMSQAQERGRRLDGGARQQGNWIQRSKSFILDFDKGPERIWFSDFKTKYCSFTKDLRDSREVAMRRQPAPHGGRSTEAGEPELSPGSGELCHTGTAGVGRGLASAGPLHRPQQSCPSPCLCSVQSGEFGYLFLHFFQRATIKMKKNKVGDSLDDSAGKGVLSPNLMI